MAGKSDYLENKILDHTLRNTAYTSPTTVYVGLFTVAPTDAGGGTEVSGGAYARQSVAFDAASGGATANSALITFPTATAAWGTVVAFGIFDQLTGGNLLYWGTITSQAVADTNTATIAAGAIDITED
jgi:hypothetical protein